MATCLAVLACMFVLQVVKLEKLANGHWTCTLHDGSSSLPGRFATQVCRQAAADKLQFTVLTSFISAPVAWATSNSMQAASHSR